MTSTAGRRFSGSGGVTNSTERRRQAMKLSATAAGSSACKGKAKSLNSGVRVTVRVQVTTRRSRLLASQDSGSIHRAIPSSHPRRCWKYQR